MLGRLTSFDKNIERRAERRRHPRITVAVKVELQLEKDATPLRTQTTNLSLGGCYVGMMFTLPVGTKARLTLWINDIPLRTDGIVATRDLERGNGIQFTHMAAQDGTRLQEFLVAKLRQGIERLAFKANGAT